MHNKKKSHGKRRDEDIERRAGETYSSTIPDALSDGVGTLSAIVSFRVVKAPGCEHWRLKPVHAAPLLDTFLSSAACGFETSLHFVEHHEFHLGKSVALEGQTEDAKTLSQRENTDILMDRLFQCCKTLTIAFNTPIFEFPFKLHAVISTEDTRAMKFSVCKFAFVSEMVKVKHEFIF